MKQTNHSGKGSRIRGVLFFLVLILLFSLVSRFFIFLSSEEGRKGMHMRDYIYTALGEERKGSLDLLVTGNSESAASYSPLEAYTDQGIASFNASAYRLKMQEIYPMVENTLKRQKIKVLVLETLSLTEPVEENEALEALMKGEAEWVFPVFRFHNIWTHGLNPLDWQPAMWKGYIIRTQVKRPKNMGLYMHPSDFFYDLPPANIRMLDRLLRLCDSKGVRLILYSAPSPQNYDMKKHNTFAKLAEERGLTYLDLNLLTDQVGVDWKTDSLDAGDHLNICGARKVTAYLSKAVKELEPDLPDRREDPGYSDWEEAAASYKKEADAGARKVMDRLAKRRARWQKAAQKQAQGQG